MSEQNCGNCDAFAINKDLQVKPGLPHQGWCRAKPPHLIQVMLPTGSPLKPGGAQMAPHWQGVFPPTSTDVWCREWRAKHWTADYKTEVNKNADGNGERPAA